MHVINSLEFGGAEKVLINIVNSEKDERFIPIVLALNDKNPLKRELSAWVDFHNFAYVRGFSFKRILDIRRFIIRHKIDLIHIHGWGIASEILAAVFFRRNIPVVLMDHGRVKPLNEVAVPTGMIGKIKKYLRSVLFGRINAVIAVSEDIKKNVVTEKRISEDKITTIINAIPKSNSSKEEDVTNVREEFGVDKSDVLITYVGRFAEIKNLPVLIEAFSRLSEKISNIKLMLIGDGPEKEKLLKIIKQNSIEDKVIMPGFRDDVKRILAISDIFVLPSFYEGISIALLESMSMGLPAVVSEVGGNTELIRNGSNGFCFSPTDTENLINILQKLVGFPELRKNMGMKSAELFNKNHTLEAVMGKYHSLYQKISREG